MMIFDDRQYFWVNEKTENIYIEIDHFRTSQGVYSPVFKYHQGFFIFRVA